jgi:NTE family protein
MFIPPLRIALNGGGIRGLAYIGALGVLEERGYLSCVREFLGVSSGAFCAFCLCIGYTLVELRQLALKLDFGTLRCIDPETIFQFPDVYGLDSGINIERLFTILLQQKGFAPTLTFRELLQVRPNVPALRMFAVDLHTCSPYEYSIQKTPDVELRLALRASVSLPVYFTPVTDPTTGHMMVDSVLVSDAPFSFLTEEERRHTLNLVFHVGRSSVDSISTLSAFLYQVYCTTFHGGITPEIAETWSRNIVELNCGSISPMHFEATEEEKAELIRAGRVGMLRFLEEGGRRPLKTNRRRFSHPSI